MAYDNRPNISNRQFIQDTGDTFVYSGTNYFHGTINSRCGYKVSGQTIFDTGEAITSLQIGCGALTGTFATAIGTNVHACASEAISIGNLSCSCGVGSISIGVESRAFCNCNVIIGHENRICADNSNILGGHSNIVYSGNCATFVGFSNCTFSSASYANSVIVPNLIIKDIAGSGSYLGMDGTGKICKINGGITGATNGLGTTSCKVCLGGTLIAPTDISGTYDFSFGGITPLDTFYLQGVQDILLELSTGGGAFTLQCVTGYGSRAYLTSKNVTISTTGATTSIQLSGTTVSVSGITKLLSTPANGVCSDSVLVWNSIDKSIKKVPYLSGGTISGSVSAERITKCIYQIFHPFTGSSSVGTVVGFSGGAYGKAIADGTYDGEVIGIVSKCHNANYFDLTEAGYVTGLTGLTASTTYFLSDTTPGLLTSIEPIIVGHISKTMLIATCASAGWVLPYIGYIITSGDSSFYTSFINLTGYTYSANTVSDYMINVISLDGTDVKIYLPSISSGNRGRTFTITDSRALGPVSILCVIANGTNCVASCSATNPNYLCSVGTGSYVTLVSDGIGNWIRTTGGFYFV